MGLFNRKKKELELEFNYDEMMAAAKLKYAKHKLNPKETIYASRYQNEEGYYRNLVELLKSNEFSYIYYRTDVSSNDITKQYEKTTEETDCIGVYDKNDKLLLAFEIDSDKLILYRYLPY